MCGCCGSRAFDLIPPCALRENCPELRVVVSQSAAVWLVIVSALCAANLPFINQRWLAIGPIAPSGKSWVGRLFELTVLYVLVGGVAMLLEKRAGQLALQGWEFYTITGTLFITLGFPGFVFRYLVRRRS